MKRTFLLCLALLPGLALPRAMPGIVRAAAAPGCAARVAVLGADMSAGGRFEVQRALKVGPHTLQLTETLADERAEAHGLVPPELLGIGAYSSALLHPLPAGSGLTVTLNPAITLDTPQTYANALLTAGVTDAEVRVAAPTSQRALGTTAMLGLLRAARTACLTISPARHDLAIREVVLTSRLAGQIGRAAAPRLVQALKGDAVKGNILSASALTALIARDGGKAGVAVPAALRSDTVAFLRDLVAGKTYASTAARRPSITLVTPLQAVARTGTAPAAPSPTVRAAGTTTAAPSTPAKPSLTGVIHGTVATASASGVTVHTGSGGAHTFSPAAALQVYRDGRPSTLGALRPGDIITVTTNAAGFAMAIHAAAPVPAHTTPKGTAHGTDNGLGGALIAILVALILLLILAIPIVLRLLRLRRATAAIGGGMATRPHRRARPRDATRPRRYDYTAGRDPTQDATPVESDEKEEE